MHRERYREYPTWGKGIKSDEEIEKKNKRKNGKLSEKSGQKVERYELLKTHVLRLCAMCYLRFAFFIIKKYIRSSVLECPTREKEIKTKKQTDEG